MNELALRYGSALFSLASETNKVSELQLEMKELKKIIDDNPDFVTLLNNDFLSIDERKAIIDTLLKDFDDSIICFIKIIVENGRAKYLSDIVISFNSLCNEYRGVKEGLLISTIPIDNKLKSEIEAKISIKEKQKVELINKIDPSLIGGVKVVINDHVYDGSIKNQIEAMRTNLLNKEEK